MIVAYFFGPPCKFFAEVYYAVYFNVTVQYLCAKRFPYSVFRRFCQAQVSDGIEYRQCTWFGYELLMVQGFTVDGVDIFYVTWTIKVGSVHFMVLLIVTIISIFSYSFSVWSCFSFGCCFLFHIFCMCIVCFNFRSQHQFCCRTVSC